MHAIARAAGAILVALLLAGPAAAQTPTLTLDGKVKQAQHWTLADLRKLPTEQVEVSYLGEHSTVKAHFTGVLLWSLIQAAGGIDDTGKGLELRHAIRFTATDGYVVVGSTGEIAPDFGAKPALIAYERDGKPLDEFRLVMPGDRRGGRYVRGLVTIAVE
ncbi:MAG TPA: molybdopterin-dependent oxidoreductase [Stellaceae bacterium]|nr:molybdopterin-dependent oxidoreductase [Stellaceae bacterium]